MRPSACEATASGVIAGSPSSRRPGPSRVWEWAIVSIRQRFLQPRSSSTSSVMWGLSVRLAPAKAASRTGGRECIPPCGSGVRSISAPWIARTPYSAAVCASSIEPDTEL